MRTAGLAFWNVAAAAGSRAVALDDEATTRTSAAPPVFTSPVRRSKADSSLMMRSASGSRRCASGVG